MTYVQTVVFFASFSFHFFVVSFLDDVLSAGLLDNVFSGGFLDNVMLRCRLVGATLSTMARQGTLSWM